MASPELTSPPGELMYMVIGLSGLSDSSQRSCATIAAETVSSIAPFKHIIRSWPGQNRAFPCSWGGDSDLEEFGEDVGFGLVSVVRARRSSQGAYKFAIHLPMY